ncbi:MAG: nucleotidyltransferase family protein [Actinobacteria bacterium]|nr:nucleotidyltransferase family protein [Actinomycetota bacterium]
MEVTPQIPTWALVHLTHTAVQSVADRAQADVLHIKGPTDAALRSRVHNSTDADVLVRPSHVDRFVAALEDSGWTLYAGFDEGSPFAHAANFSNPTWSLVDVHRSFPGFRRDPVAVFDRLWEERQQIAIAHRPCATLAPHAQVLIQVLHVARSHGTDLPETWQEADDVLRAKARALASDLGAEVAFAAGLGELDAHRDAREYALWRHWSQPEDNRLNEWMVRIRAASGPRERFRLLAQATRVNRTRLRMDLGHEPSRHEIRVEQRSRIRKALTSAVAMFSRRRP